MNVFLRASFAISVPGCNVSAIELYIRLTILRRRFLSFRLFFLANSCCKGFRASNNTSYTDGLTRSKAWTENSIVGNGNRCKILNTREEKRRMIGSLPLRQFGDTVREVISRRIREYERDRARWMDPLSSFHLHHYLLDLTEFQIQNTTI